MSPLLKALAAVGLVVAGIFLIFSIFGSGDSAEEKIAQEYLTAVAEKDYSSAHALLCTNQKKRLTSDDLRAEWERLFAGSDGAKLKVIGAGKDSGGISKVRWDFVDDRGKQSHQLSLAREKDGWRVCGDEIVSSD